MIALGTDILGVVRVEAVVARLGDKFVRRILTLAEQGEYAASQQPVRLLAKRFAAKEAAMKALGTGHAQGVTWRDIEVVRSEGPPQLRFHGTAARRAEALG